MKAEIRYHDYTETVITPKETDMIGVAFFVEKPNEDGTMYKHSCQVLDMLGDWITFDGEEIEEEVHEKEIMENVRLRVSFYRSSQLAEMCAGFRDFPGMKFVEINNEDIFITVTV